MKRITPYVLGLMLALGAGSLVAAQSQKPDDASCCGSCCCCKDGAQCCEKDKSQGN